MDEIFPVGEAIDEITIEGCRELLGDEASDLCDKEVDRIRQCADTVAQAVIDGSSTRNAGRSTSACARTCDRRMASLCCRTWSAR